MNERFKAMGKKGWGITDSGFIHGKKFFSYSEITEIKILTVPKNCLMNGVISACANGKRILCAYKNGEKERVRYAVDFASKKINETHGA